MLGYDTIISSKRTFYYESLVKTIYASRQAIQRHNALLPTPISCYKLAKCFTENFRIIAIARSALSNLKCTTNRLASGLSPDLLGELTALPRSPS